MSGVIGPPPTPGGKGLPGQKGIHDKLGIPMPGAGGKGSDGNIAQPHTKLGLPEIPGLGGKGGGGAKIEDMIGKPGGPGAFNADRKAARQARTDAKRKERGLKPTAEINKPAAPPKRPGREL